MNNKIFKKNVIAMAMAVLTFISSGNANSNSNKKSLGKIPVTASDTIKLKIDMKGSSVTATIDGKEYVFTVEEKGEQEQVTNFEQVKSTPQKILEEAQITTTSKSTTTSNKEIESKITTSNEEQNRDMSAPGNEDPVGDQVEVEIKYVFNPDTGKMDIWEVIIGDISPELKAYLKEIYGEKYDENYNSINVDSRELTPQEREQYAKKIKKLEEGREEEGKVSGSDLVQ